jgi:uncharacterized protein (TIGR02145 family)
MKRLVLLLSVIIFFTTCKKNITTSTTSPPDNPPAADTSIMHTGLVASTEQELQGIQSIDVLDTASVPFIKRTLGLPEFVSISVPPPGNQGDNNSCVGWVVGYGMLSYEFKNIEGHTDYNGSDKLFSPNYIWNQKNDGNKDQSISFGTALGLVESQGCCKLTDMPVSVSPSTLPTAIAKADAANYKLSNFYRFFTTDITKMKFYLSRGYPIMVGIEVDDDFKNLQKNPFEKQSDGRLVWKKYTSNGRYGHALLICGYDNAINAFKVLNSWGSSFGNKGYIWIDYDFFKTAVAKTLGLIPEIYVGVVRRPVLSITPLGAISQNSVQSGGTILSDWGVPVTSRGVCWSTFPDPTIAGNKTIDGTGMGSFVSNISGLTSNTTYYLKAYATNSTGTSYGTEVSFTTTAPVVALPTISTTTVTSISQTSAISGGIITLDGGTSVTARGVCWSTSANPTIADNKTTDGTGMGTFASSLTGLTANTTYYVRAYATNSAGTAYGSDISFTTQQTTGTTVTDIDGNVYNTVTIGTQVWMAENLKTSHYRNGDPIPQVTDSTQWENLGSGAWCYYNNDPANGTIYGKLYNWYTVNDPRDLAPQGWHIPTDAEWTTLTTFLGGGNVAGGKLKETGTSHWLSPNFGATNESGFTGLPGGYRWYLGTFVYVGNYGVWWSSTEDYTSNAWGRFLIYSGSYIYLGSSSKPIGFSVRCVKD